MTAATDGSRRALAGNLACLLAFAAMAAASAWWQDGDWWLASPRPSHWIGGGATLTGFVAWVGWHLWRTRPRAGAVPEIAQHTWLVLHASQTGFAEVLAARTADTLREAGGDVRVVAIRDADMALLARASRVLFVASTTGEGDPPDPALRFVRDAMSTTPDLAHLEYAVLALGDRTYEQVCAFGHALDRWLRAAGARPLCDVVEVDNGDPGALRLWQHHLSLMTERPDLADWTTPVYAAWTLASRRLVNPGSVGGGAWDIALSPPPSDHATWTAGDIAEIGPRHAPATVTAWLDAARADGDAAAVSSDGGRITLRDALAASQLPVPEAMAGHAPQAIVDALVALPHREYSIASLPSEGPLRLLVRRMTRPDGTTGIGSGWLCEGAEPGGPVAVRLRANANFHPPAIDRPLVLIGNGTGIAGLRAHLAARAAAGASRTWLLFGERNAALDAFYDADLVQWQSAGVLERLDRVWSRDGGDARYVQDRVTAVGDTLRAWIDAGASVYVCGSLQGMAPGVDAALRAVLGDARVETLLADGRYRRDVY